MKLRFAVAVRGQLVVAVAIASQDATETVESRVRLVAVREEPLLFLVCGRVCDWSESRPNGRFAVMILFACVFVRT